MNKPTPIFRFLKSAKLLLILLLLNSCAEVKPWQRAWLNDPALQPDRALRSFDDYTHAIREGATMPGGDKSSGGCGCN
ncbi:MAG: DUF4266 domain-containing protein [Bacteroidia bacterium]|nr:DUF4266 domain-containing protein [Ferruginibacter sp.]